MKQNYPAPITGTVSIFNDPSVGDQFTSFSPADMDGKIKLYNAINSPDHRLADFINTPVEIVDVVITRVKLAEKISEANARWNEETLDNERQGFRVVIIDKEGKSYTATSTGIYNSICTLRAVFGDLHFEGGLKTVVRQIKTKNGNTLTLSLTE